MLRMEYSRNPINIAYMRMLTQLPDEMTVPLTGIFRSLMISSAASLSTMAVVYTTSLPFASFTVAETLL